MSVKPIAEITPAKLRSGEPEVLAALCRRCGTAVLAYCTKVVGPQHAVQAASEALAQFRLVASPPGALTSAVQAVTLLRQVTRRAAMAAVAISTVSDGFARSDDCYGWDADLFAFSAKTLEPVDRERVAAHVARCPACEAMLGRLEAAEAAFRLTDASLPGPIAGEMLTALVGVAPVTACGGDVMAVWDAALLLLTGTDEVTAAVTAPAADPVADPRPDPGSSNGNALGGHELVPSPTAPADNGEHAPPAPVADIADRPTAEPAGDAHDHAEPIAHDDERDHEEAAPGSGDREAAELDSDAREHVQPAAGTDEDDPEEPVPAPVASPDPPRPLDPLDRRAPPAPAWDRARRRFPLPFPGRDREPMGPTRSTMLLRELAKLAAVVVLTGGVGILLGTGVAQLTGNDASPTSPTSATTPVAAGEKLPISLLSATARTAGNGSRLTVRVRVENALDRIVRPEPPVLLVDGDRIKVAPSSPGTTEELLGPSLYPGVAIAGTLRFDVPSMTASELTAASVRLRMLGKLVSLKPTLADAAAPG